VLVYRYKGDIYVADSRQDPGSVIIGHYPESPNCYVSLQVLYDMPVPYVVASRDIAAGEPLTFDWDIYTRHSLKLVREFAEASLAETSASASAAASND
jgi:hypothetical protein